MSLRIAITAFFLLSGCTALVYQVIWVRMLGLLVGHSVLAVSTVVATYMAGLGLGARLAGARADSVKHPLAAYGALEAFIGMFALGSPAVLGNLEPLVAGLGGDSGRVLGTLAASALALMPPTLAMGATLPFITRWYARDAATLGRDMGWLYAVNTTGAFVGAGAAGFLLLPWLGQPGALNAAASLNIAVGVAAIALGRSVPLAPNPPSAGAAPQHAEEALPPLAVWTLLASFSLSGAAGMVNQVAWSRGFSLFTGSTTYAFSLIVCAFIAGLAIGGHLLAQVVDRVSNRVRLLALVNLGIAFTTAVLIPVIGRLPLWLLRPIAARADSFASTQWFVFGVLFALVFLPTLLMGGTYSVATRALSTDPEDAPRQVGVAYAWNTGGAILGSIVGGLVLIPLVGLRGTLWVAVICNLLAAAALLGRLAWALPAVGLLGLLTSPAWDPRTMNLAPHMYASDLVENPQRLRDMLEGGALLFHEEGVGATVSVLQRESGARVLRINGKTDASSHEDRLGQGLIGALPMVLSGGTDDALVIGLGSGMTLAAALAHPVKEVVTVELLPEVIRGAEQFGPLIGDPLTDPRANTLLGDGRHELRYGTRRYDVVSSQPTNMFISGISTLFTADAFREMRLALDEGGVALVWVQGYLLRDEDFRTVVRTFLSVFPQAHLWNAGPFDFALTGSVGALDLDPDRLAERIAHLGGTAPGVWTGLRRVEDLQRHYLLGPADLAALAGPGPIHRDRDPFLEFTAPRGLFGGEDLLDVDALLARRRPLPLDGPPPQLEAACQRRLQSTLEFDRVARGSDLSTLLGALAADPAHPFGLQREARLRHERSLQLALAGDLQAAARHAERVVELEPLALPAYRVLAQIDLLQGDPASARARLDEARRLQPWNPFAQGAYDQLPASSPPAHEPTEQPPAGGP